jgi:hypothetical protein
MGIDSYPDAQGTLVDHVLIDGSSTAASDDLRACVFHWRNRDSTIQSQSVSRPAVFKKRSQAVISRCLTSAQRGGRMKTTLLGRFRKLLFTAALGLVAIAIGAGPAAATYPGANGRIVFTTGTNDLWSVLDDGSGLELLTTVLAPPGVSSFASYPSFSADGSKIAVMLNELDRPTPCDPGGINGGSGPCRALVLMNADGSNQQVVYQSEDIASLQLSLSPGRT